MAFRFCGFADEAGKKVEEQIAATKELGWKGIEIRMVEGQNFCALDDAAFWTAIGKLQAAGLCVPSFGSAIANWARPITNDFQTDVDDLKRNLPRMKKLGCKIIRIMSYPNHKEKPWGEAEWKKETLRRLKVLAKMAEDGGVVLGHENCDGYANTLGTFLELAEELNSPAFKLIFDTGNQTEHQQSAAGTWDYYQGAKQHICHVHIKAARKDPASGRYRFCYPDEDPVQIKVLRDLKARGYDGWLSIEPHLEAQVHAAKDVGDSQKATWVYIEYGKRLMKMCESL